MKDSDNSGIDLPGGIYHDKEKKAHTSVDVFAANAGKMVMNTLKRNNIRRRWNKNVSPNDSQASEANDVEKQTVDHGQNGDDGEHRLRNSAVEEAIDGCVKKKTMEEVRELGIVLAANRKVMHQFYRRAFIYSILPGTAIACL